MSTHRRNFIRTLAVGSSVFATGLPAFAQAPTEEELERSKQYAS